MSRGRPEKVAAAFRMAGYFLKLNRDVVQQRLFEDVNTKKARVERAFLVARWFAGTANERAGSVAVELVAQASLRRDVTGRVRAQSKPLHQYEWRPDVTVP